MNAKEKIEKIFFAYIDNGEGGAEIDFDGFYDHLIKEFPQIEKKPVRVMLLYDSEWSIEKQYYIQGIGYSEQARQDWIDSHYVEVV